MARPPCNRSTTVQVVMCAMLALATLALFWPVTGNQFIHMDDPEYVTANPQVQAGLTWRGVRWAFTAFWAANWHPLTWLSHMADVSLFGLNPAGHFAVNVILHVLNAVLAFAVLSRATGATWRSLVVAGFFALHPLHVESVAWISERKDVLSACFGLLALLAYVRFARVRSGGAYAAVVVLFGLSLLAKPMMVTLPVVLLLLDIWPLGRFGQDRDAQGAPVRPATVLIEKIPLLAMSLAVGIVTVAAQTAGGAVVSLNSLSISTRLANAVVAYPRYLGHALFPWGLSPLYLDRARWGAAAVAGAAALLVAASAAAWVLRRRAPHLLVGWVWFLVVLAPVSGLVQVGSMAMADRYMYLPLLGLAIPVTWGIAELTAASSSLRKVAAAAASAALGACALLTFFQVGHWKDGVSLYSRAVELAPQNVAARENLAIALESAGRPDAAADQYRAALHLWPTAPIAGNNLALMLWKGGQRDEALDLLRRVVAAHPNEPQCAFTLGMLLREAERFDESAAAFETVLAADSSRTDAHAMLAEVLFRVGRYVDALAHLQAVVQAEPQNKTVRANLVAALYLAGRHADAWKELQACREIGCEPTAALVADLTAEFGGAPPPPLGQPR